MGFAGKVWRLLVGIKDALALLFLLLFFAALFAVLSARPNKGIVREGALLIELDGSVVEEVAPIDPLAMLLSQAVPTRQYAARDVVRAIDAAAGDARVKALALDLTTFLGGGQVHMQAIAEAIDRFRAARKPVLTYAVAYSDDSMMLAAHASEVWVDPMGGVALTGPGGSNIYYAGLLERFKVNARVFRVGTFKSAVEPYLLSGMSPEARENAEAYLGALWSEWQANVKLARPAANIELATQRIPEWLAASGGDLARAALAAGLADKLGTRVEWGARVAEIAGRDTWTREPGAFAATDLDAWLADHEPSDAGAAIGVITIAGEIGDGEAGPGSAGAERIVRLLDEALARDLKALVVRVDSPGGTVTGSESIRRAILRHKARGIPIAVSMGNVAASGGYWVATPGQRIFAEPETITGSIGIFGVVPTFEDALADWGVTSDGVRTTPLSGQPDVLGGFTPETEAILQATVESGYRRFVGLVAQSRKMTPARADELGQGRVWDGGSARQLGLVDQFGGLDDALAWAAAQAKLENGAWHAEYLGAGDTQLPMLWRMIQGQRTMPGAGSDVFALFARAQNARLAQAVGDLEALFEVRGMQARCLECPAAEAPAARAPLEAAGTGLLARLAGLLRD
ncbi:MAG: signal peptide peptidase SppA [Sphingomonadales bacterium 32-68-7]|nr:MAG: signal peptide peptidase SppA [Sphingomonadales bacterium 12-68-11]OYX09465.1 MAG: signal peptide peptidase SppA [Sphingomonadales bacterium 32-68-7]